MVDGKKLLHKKYLLLRNFFRMTKFRASQKGKLVNDDFFHKCTIDDDQCTKIQHNDADSVHH